MIKKKVKANKKVKSKQRKKKSQQDDEKSLGKTSPAATPSKPLPARDKLGHLLPGNTANPGGRTKNAFSLTTLLLHILQKNKGQSKQSQGEELMKALLKYAKKGNSKLIDIIMNRIDGKVPDRLFTTQTNPLSETDEEKLNEIIHAGEEKEQSDDPE